MRIRIFLLVFSLFAVSIVIYLKFFKLKEADYRFVGKFSYRVSDEKLFNETYLAKGSFGYLIGDLPIPGLEIKDSQRLETGKEYIFSVNRCRFL